MNSFFDQLVNQIALTHKNPRVKQLVLDRVEVIVVNNFLSDSGHVQQGQQVLSIFKQIKEKLKQLIVKDTNANVRDAGVSLLAQFRILAGCSDEDPAQVQEVINSLPK